MVDEYLMKKVYKLCFKVHGSTKEEIFLHIFVKRRTRSQVDMVKYLELGR